MRLLQVTETTTQPHTEKISQQENQVKNDESISTSTNPHILRNTESNQAQLVFSDPPASVLVKLKPSKSRYTLIDEL